MNLDNLAQIPTGFFFKKQNSQHSIYGNECLAARIGIQEKCYFSPYTRWQICKT